MAEKPGEGESSDWADTIRKLQSMWTEAQLASSSGEAGAQAHYTDPANWAAAAQALSRLLPQSQPETRKRLWEEGACAVRNCPWPVRNRTKGRGSGRGQTAIAPQ
jgi:hypothetical protein